jgi:hypothetical protein
MPRGSFCTENKVRNGTVVQDVLPPIKVHNLGNAGNAKPVRKRAAYYITLAASRQASQDAQQ